MREKLFSEALALLLAASTASSITITDMSDVSTPIPDDTPYTLEVGSC